MDFALLAARLVLDEVHPVQFPDIAIQPLVGGNRQSLRPGRRVVRNAVGR